jgi:hypothetical protein
MDGLFCIIEASLCGSLGKFGLSGLARPVASMATCSHSRFRYPHYDSESGTRKAQARRSPPPCPRYYPEDINLGRIQSDLEFLIERVSKLPTRRELVLRPLLVVAESAGLVIAWIELFRRVCL